MKDLATFSGQAQLAARVQQLLKTNEVSQRFGLSLREEQITSLIQAEGESLRAAGRLEFGEGILPRLIHTFCDSPYINRETFSDILHSLQELFYLYHNELDDVLTDDELLEAMSKLYNGKAQGSIEYLENIAVCHLLEALRSDCMDSEDDRDDDYDA